MKIEGTGLPPVGGPGKASEAAAGRIKRAVDGLSGADGLELSAVARALAQLALINDVREELVERLIAQIEAGEYLDEDKLRSAVLRMLGEI
ncbi:MAG TPA: flagellar biosynthesis anti-sigma factor FlgM [Planctomycetes bacterium]|nr:flagellar biosynthesis anti-sigma factor FlgM [Planctomycetota bacterium]